MRSRGSDSSQFQASFIMALLLVVGHSLVLIKVQSAGTIEPFISVLASVVRVYHSHLSRAHLVHSLALGKELLLV